MPVLLILTSLLLAQSDAAAKPDVTAYCDAQFASFEKERPTPEHFIERVNDKHVDSPVEYIQRVFDKMNDHYTHMRKAGCPAAQLEAMNDYAGKLTGALKANNQTMDAAQFRKAARRDHEEE